VIRQILSDCLGLSGTRDSDSSGKQMTMGNKKSDQCRGCMQNLTTNKRTKNPRLRGKTCPE